MFTTVDLGVDIVLDNDLKIQVKGSFLQRKKDQHSWKVAQWRWSPETNSYSSKRSPLVRPDFFALWAIEPNDWYIVPFSDNAVFWTNKKKPSIIDPYKNAWDGLSKSSTEENNDGNL